VAYDNGRDFGAEAVATGAIATADIIPGAMDW
jgi:hypothetical protein